MPAVLDLAVFASLAAACAPAVHVDTLASIARTESRFDAHAVNLNGPGGGTQRVGSREDAIALTTELVVGRGRSVDLGLMQVNSTNLPRLGLTIADAFDPCRSLAAGARVLREGYEAAVAAGEADPQRALGVALSRYNTGHPERGFRNGYVERVQASAERVVPAIRLRSDPDGSPGSPPSGAAAGDPSAAPVVRLGRITAEALPPPAHWDVYGQVLRGREGSASPPARPGGGRPPIVAPVQRPSPPTPAAAPSRDASAPSSPLAAATTVAQAEAGGGPAR